MARIFDIVAVLMDGSTPSGNDSQLVQSLYPLELHQGIDATLRLTVRRQSQALLDLTGCEITFGWGSNPVDSASGVEALLQRLAVNQSPLANGVSFGVIVPSDTLQMRVNGSFGWGAWIKLADGTREPLVPLSPVAIVGSAVVPGTPVTVPAVSTPNEQSGIEVFTAQVERTVTLAAAYATTGYKITLGVNDSVGVYYEKLSVTQFKIKASAPFTGEVSWHTEP